MKRTANSKRQKKTTSLGISTLAHVMNNWYQAASTFYAMYTTLELALRQCKPTNGQQNPSVNDLSKPYSTRVLEYVSHTVMHELDFLSKELGEPAGLHYESEKELMEQLHSHAIQLNKHTKRMQWALSVSELNLNN